MSRPSLLCALARVAVLAAAQAVLDAVNRRLGVKPPPPGRCRACGVELASEEGLA